MFARKKIEYKATKRDKQVKDDTGVFILVTVVAIVAVLPVFWMLVKIFATGSI